ncbi:UPF0104 family protein [Amycolatopsis sp. K13G38]|uniref:UPF0104 family protein n=1 Tax=Amycolatopsis acididurans TaxID=2724524 RepID=A0ABX1IXX7_9PSEU|nr:YbhN family protein [Amycolatopsis acididurans]NKQ52347.1 UPF0104 family protein [Amycolatopsis acididurans]
MSTSPVPAGKRRLLRIVVAALLTAAVVALLVAGWPTVSQVPATLRSVNPFWAATALALEALSLLGTAQLQRVMLAAAGASPPGLRDHVAVTYVGAAISGGLPGGSALGTAYVYRQLRARGVTAARIGLALTAAGLLSTAMMALVSVAALTFVGSAAGSAAASVVELGVVVALVVLARWVVRHPGVVAAIARWCVARINGLRRRPASLGGDAVSSVVSGLAGIRLPGSRQAAALGWSLADRGADIACLALCLVAVGTPIPSLAAVVTAYVAGVAASQVSLTPAGLGITEAAMTAALVAHGSPAQAALAAVLLFRLFSPGVNVGIGAAIGLARAGRTRMLPRSGQVAALAA